MRPYLDESTVRQLTDDVTEPAGDDMAVTSQQRGSPPTPSQEQERERRGRPEILDEDLNDDDVSVHRI